jgi:hypothetical protein
LHQSDIAVAQSSYCNVAASPLFFWEAFVNTLQLKHQDTVKQDWKNIKPPEYIYSLNVILNIPVPLWLDIHLF